MISVITYPSPSITKCNPSKTQGQLSLILKASNIIAPEHSYESLNHQAYSAMLNISVRDADPALLVPIKKYVFIAT